MKAVKQNFVFWLIKVCGDNILDVEKKYRDINIISGKTVSYYV